MNITEHLVHCEAAIAECERCLKDAKAHVLSASARSASIPRSLIEPFIRQCRARLNDTLRDEDWIMRASLDGNDVVVTAGEARALVGAFEGAPKVYADSWPSLDEVMKLRKLLDAVGPLIEHCRRMEREVPGPWQSNGIIDLLPEDRRDMYTVYDEVRGAQ